MLDKKKNFYYNIISKPAQQISYRDKKKSVEVYKHRLNATNNQEVHAQNQKVWNDKADWLKISTANLLCEISRASNHFHFMACQI